jgi:hypothetical protein
MGVRKENRALDSGSQLARAVPQPKTAPENSFLKEMELKKGPTAVGFQTPGAGERLFF